MNSHAQSLHTHFADFQQPARRQSRTFQFAVICDVLPKFREYVFELGLPRWRTFGFGLQREKLIQTLDQMDDLSSPLRNLPRSQRVAR